MRKYGIFFLVTFFIATSSLLLVGCSIPNSNEPLQSTEPGNTSTKPSESVFTKFSYPIGRGVDRVTKKTFGLQVSPKNSPISPEKFSGYHTGVDFETFDSEQDQEITVKAICAGPLVLKKWATGYGGVIVQKCTLNKESITVVYGHLQLASIIHGVGSEVQSDQKIGILGKGYSHETDGERKHLHLSIHRGEATNIRGYVPRFEELNQWLDPLKYLK